MGTTQRWLLLLGGFLLLVGIAIGVVPIGGSGLDEAGNRHPALCSYALNPETPQFRGSNCHGALAPFRLASLSAIAGGIVLGIGGPVLFRQNSETLR